MQWQHMTLDIQSRNFKYWDCNNIKQNENVNSILKLGGKTGL